MKRAVFPGSFDPITLGHVDIIERGLALFNEIIIAIGENSDKKHMFSLAQRKAFIEAAFEGRSNILIKTYSGLTAHFCIAEEAPFILRGLRNSTDFNYEAAIAQTNYKMAGVESIFLISSPAISNISSSIVRDVIRNGGDCTSMVPKGVKQ